MQGSSSYRLDTASAYDDTLLNFEISGYSAISRKDNSTKLWADNFNYGYDDLTTYYTDGSDSYHMLESGSSDGTYAYLGDGTYKWYAETGDILAGDGAVETYSDSYVDTYSEGNTSSYADNLLWETDSDGYEMFSGTQNTVRSVQGGSTNHETGTSTYDDKLPNSENGDYNAHSRTTNWTNVSVDNFDSSYDNLTTYYTDGIVEYDVFEIGGGNGSWDYAADGTYSRLSKSGDVLAGNGWQETYDEEFASDSWRDYDYSYIIDTSTTSFADVEISKTGTVDETGDVWGGGDGWSSNDRKYVSAETSTDATSSSSTDDHWEGTWDELYQHDYHDLTTYNADGSVVVSSDKTGSGSGGWDWLASHDQIDAASWGDATDGGTSHTDDHYTASGYENYDFDYVDDLTVTIAADGTETRSGTLHRWGGGDGNADSHQWNTSKWTTAQSDAYHSYSSYDETTSDIVSNDSYLHTYDFTTSYADNSSTGDLGTTQIGGDSHEEGTSSGNWTDTYYDENGGSWTDSDSYTDSFTSFVAPPLVVHGLRPTLGLYAADGDLLDLDGPLASTVYSDFQSQRLGLSTDFGRLEESASQPFFGAMGGISDLFPAQSGGMTELLPAREMILAQAPRHRDYDRVIAIQKLKAFKSNYATYHSERSTRTEKRNAWVNLRNITQWYLSQERQGHAAAEIFYKGLHYNLHKPFFNDLLGRRSNRRPPIGGGGNVQPPGPGTGAPSAPADRPAAELPTDSDPVPEVDWQ
ncbi:MAG: hypothetical protein IH991_04620, partial [Planctomycetes bacterium]|nr:hypothetical protein [Planctomycetota bacterium]